MSDKKPSVFLVIKIIIFKILFGAMVFVQASCNKQQPYVFLNEKLLGKEFKINSAVRVQSLLEGDFELVCVLNPYQESILNKNEDSKKINSYLRAIEYKGNESQWGFVTLKGNVSSVFLFRRTGSVDIASSGLNGLADIKLPEGFKIRECARFSDAELFKFEVDSRVYVLFGSAR